jgi:hypothetical protein
MTRDYFMILGLGREATSEQIKQAYREKVRQYHPDLNPDPAAAARFQEVVEAYEVLSDEAKRQVYVARTFPQAHQRPSPPQASPAWAFKQERLRRKNDYLYWALVFFSLAMLGSLLIGWNQRLSLAEDLEEAQCRVMDWEVTRDSDGRQYYDLHYTIQLPWLNEPSFEFRRFESLNQNYEVGENFTCYYNKLTKAPPYRFERYELLDWLRSLPWLLLALAGLSYGAYRLII